MSLKATCNICKKSVNDRNSIICTYCHSHTHLKCNSLNYVDAQLLRNASSFNNLWSCQSCNQKIFPFTSINNYKLSSLFSEKPYCETKESSLILKPPSNLKKLFSEF